MADTVRVFIGSEAKTYIAAQVLKCAIDRRTQATIEYTVMDGPDWQTPPVRTGTGFSLRHWLIPAKCAWTGRAIYLDADQLVFADILELWHKPETKPAPRGVSAWLTYQPDKFQDTPWPQTSVMVIDCAWAQAQWGWHLDRMTDYFKTHTSQADYALFMHGHWMAPPPARIENHWNNLNVYVKGKTRLLHYTKEPEQPWYKPEHPLARLWEFELSVALNLGYVTAADLKKGLDAWGKKEDWRHTNGLHPHYAKYL